MRTFTIIDDVIDPNAPRPRLKPALARLLEERTRHIGDNTYLAITPEHNADLIPLLADPFEEAPQ